MITDAMVEKVAQVLYEMLSAALPKSHGIILSTDKWEETNVIAQGWWRDRAREILVALEDTFWGPEGR